MPSELLRGALQHRAEFFDEVVDVFELAVDRGESHEGDLANLGRCWLARGEPQKYIEHVEELSNEERAAALYDHSEATLADCLKAIGDSAAASKLRQKQINAGSRDPAFYSDEAKALLDAGQPQEALAVLDQAEKLLITNEYTSAIRQVIERKLAQPTDRQAPAAATALEEAGSRRLVDREMSELMARLLAAKRQR